MRSRVVPGHSGLLLLTITCPQSRGFPGVVTETANSHWRSSYVMKSTLHPSGPTVLWFSNVVRVYVVCRLFGSRNRQSGLVTTPGRPADSSVSATKRWSARWKGQIGSGAAYYDVDRVRRGGM